MPSSLLRDTPSTSSPTLSSLSTLSHSRVAKRVDNGGGDANEFNKIAAQHLHRLRDDQSDSNLGQLV